MATYNLTANDDAISAGNGTDMFQGVSGGNDVLRGNGGNDFFTVVNGQTGLIDGGIGYDRLYLSGAGFNQLDPGLRIARVEELVTESTNLYATLDQIDEIEHFGVNGDPDEFYFFLSGEGGTLDFSRSWTDPVDLAVEALTDSAVKITGSAGKDMIIASDYNDTLNGGADKDTMYGGAGKDIINGGAGRDYLYGDDGRDTFLFDTALSGNIDNLGDFRPKDDTIRLDDAIFDWAGQSRGALESENFKIIGTGQSIDADDHVIYRQTNGALYYDVDGAGGQAMVQFAVADNFSGDVPLITYRDFVIV